MNIKFTDNSDQVKAEMQEAVLRALEKCGLTAEGLVELVEGPGVYWERLDVFEEEGLEKLEKVTGKRRKKRTKQVKKERRQTKKRVSRTDPEAGYMNRPGKPKGMHYLSHQAVDSDHGVITGVAATSGDVNDSVPFLDLIEDVQKTVNIQAVTADAAYDFPLAHRVLYEQNISFFVRPQKKFDRSTAEFTRERFAFDEVADAYICPQGKTLKLNTLSRTASGLSWQYAADKQDCVVCPVREKCLCPNDRRGARKIKHSYFTPERQANISRQETPEYRAALKLRQIWCEGSFAAQKRSHNLTGVLRQGLEAAEDHCLLSATALNLKRMIKCAE